MKRIYFPFFSAAKIVLTNEDTLNTILKNNIKVLFTDMSKEALTHDSDCHVAMFQLFIGRNLVPPVMTSTGELYRALKKHEPEKKPDLEHLAYLAAFQAHLNPVDGNLYLWIYDSKHAEEHNIPTPTANLIPICAQDLIAIPAHYLEPKNE